MSPDLDLFRRFAGVSLSFGDLDEPARRAVTRYWAEEAGAVIPETARFGYVEVRAPGAIMDEPGSVN